MTHGNAYNTLKDDTDCTDKQVLHYIITELLHLRTDEKKSQIYTMPGKCATYSPSAGACNLPNANRFLWPPCVADAVIIFLPCYGRPIE